MSSLQLASQHLCLAGVGGRYAASWAVRSPAPGLCRGSQHRFSRPRHRIAAKTDEEVDELPSWARKEELQKLAAEAGPDLPFPVYLLSSVIIAIAAVGSVYEWFNKNPIFGVVQPGNALYTPILGFFALTGIPLAGFLFIRAVKSANSDADRQDRADGYR